MAHAGFIEIGIDVNGSFLGVHPRTPELDHAIIEAGQDPTIHNRLKWPIGASRWASGRFLMHKKLVSAIVEQSPGGTEIPALFFGGILFDKMFMRNPIPLLTSHGSGVVFSVELVDERFLWQGVSSTIFPGFNVTLDDKDKLYDVTELGVDGNPFTPSTALTILKNAATSEPFEIPTPLNELDVSLLDLIVKGLPVAELIDKVLTHAGYVLTANPNPAYDGSSFRYRPKRIDAGEAVASEMLTAGSDDILAGGLYGPSSEFAAPTQGAGSVAFGDPAWQEQEVPEAIEVQFPIAAEPGHGYSFNVEAPTAEVDYVTERWESITSQNGKPRNTAGNGRIITAFDSLWARVNAAGTVNINELTTRADLVAFEYYSRFFAGCGNTIFRGIQKIEMHSGAGEIVWSLNDFGPTTRVRGDFHDPLFGFGVLQPLRPADIHTIGGVRSMPRPDGGVLIDSPQLVVTVMCAMVTPVLPEFAPNRWDYDWHEAVLDPITNEWIVKPGGVQSGISNNRQARNKAESKNDLVTSAHGVLLSPGSGATGVVEPIPADTPVFLYRFPKIADDITPWWFSEPNGINFACPAPLTLAEEISVLVGASER